jgi:hypothetical protein
MTMPHLMNCGHSDTGWCLACVKELHDEKEAAEASLAAATEERDKLREAYQAAHDQWTDANIRATQMQLERDTAIERVERAERFATQSLARIQIIAENDHDPDRIEANPTIAEQRVLALRSSFRLMLKARDYWQERTLKSEARLSTAEALAGAVERRRAADKAYFLTMESDPHWVTASDECDEADTAEVAALAAYRAGQPAGGGE